MPRYEFSEGTSNKFWEITLEGTSFSTRYGKIGTDGQSTTKTFASPAEAKKAHDKLVAEKVGKGYELVAEDEDEDANEEAEAGPENPALEAAILDNPDDAHAYQVYGDWLQSQGDPRGELVAVQAARLASPGVAELAAAEQKLLKKHAARFLGGLAAFATTADGRDTAAFAWHLGFLRTARLAWDHHANEEAEVDLAESTTTLLSHPSARFLHGLTIGINRDDPDCEYQGVLDAIAETGHPALRELFVGDYEYPDDIEISWTVIGSMGSVWSTLPRLERCVLQGGSIDLGTIVAPRLRHLELRTGGLPAEALRSIAAAELPALETLIVWTGSDGYGGSCTFDDVLPLLTGKNLPRLRHLGIVNSEHADAVCQALATAPILAQLETLDLSMGTMSDVGRQALVAAKPALAHLSRLDLSKNTLASVEGLADLCANVDVSGQRADDMYDEHRYVMVGE
jgi:uncharacterized protein (TIGR02996 family)